MSEAEKIVRDKMTQQIRRNLLSHLEYGVVNLPCYVQSSEVR